MMSVEISMPLLAAALAMTTAAGCGRADTGQPGETVPGAERSGTTAALEAGADVMQSTEPVDRIALHLVGFHPSKSDPRLQFESHHFCDQVNEDFMQCVLYDGDTADARLHGIEYIISEKLYATLPADEKPYWHPHNYEILSGQLQMPGLPDAAEGEALKRKINSYGKTWHVWKSGVSGQPPDSLPLGPAHLAWSFNRDGEANPAMVQARDVRMGLDTAEARRERAEWASLARPQAGVDALAQHFPDATGTPAGVIDNGDTGTRAVPVLTMQRP